MSDDTTPPDDDDNTPTSSGRQSSVRNSGARKTADKPASTGLFSTAMGDINRLREIASVLSRHGFHGLVRRTGLEKILGDRLSPPPGQSPVDPSDQARTARRLREVLEELGATFIKLGQILSTRPDLLPQPYIKEFEKLQDQIPPMGFDQVRAQVEQALGASIEELFSSFESAPLAVASIGQVHEATARDGGHRVVVKVRRIGIAEQIRSDLDILHFLARILQATVAETDIYNVGEIVREFERAIGQELDFAIEAHNLRRMRDNTRDNPHVVIPEVIDDLSCGTVLTLEYLDGRKLSDIEAGSAEAARLVEILVDAVYEQIFVHGIFHGDPHPGNILVLGPEKVALIDLGLVGQLSRAQQDDLVTLLLTIINEDVEGIARTILRMGQPQGRVSLAELKREIARLRHEHLKSQLDDIDLSAFTIDLMEVAKRFRIRLSPEYSVLVKSTVTLEGVLRKLQPDMDLVATARPMARRLMLERYNSKKLLQTALTGAISLSGFLRDVPAQLDQVLMDLESGTVTVNVRNPEVDKLGGELRALGTRIFLGLVCCGLIMGGSWMVASLDDQFGHVPVVFISAAVMLTLASVITFWALAWPHVRTRLKPVEVGPIIAFFKRLLG